LRAALLGAACGLGAGDAADAETARRAEEAFRAGAALRGEKERARRQFEESARLYGELEARGVASPGLYLNLGNARLLADDVAGAIVAYHRGLRLAPSSGELEAGLERARGQVDYPSEGALGRTPQQGWPWWLPRVGSGWLWGGAAAAYALAWLGLTRWRMVRRGWLLGGVAGAALATAGLAVLGWLALGREGEAATRTVVVIARDGVLLRKGNGWLRPGVEPAYPPRYATALNRGVEARLLARRGDWLQLELAGGEVGWAPASAVLIDGP
jgi:hypothetical protein